MSSAHATGRDAGPRITVARGNLAAADFAASGRSRRLQAAARRATRRTARPRRPAVSGAGQPGGRRTGRRRRRPVRRVAPGAGTFRMGEPRQHRHGGSAARGNPPLAAAIARRRGPDRLDQCRLRRQPPGARVTAPRRARREPSPSRPRFSPTCRPASPPRPFRRRPCGSPTCPSTISSPCTPADWTMAWRSVCSCKRWKCSSAESIVGRTPWSAADAPVGLFSSRTGWSHLAKTPAARCLKRCGTPILYGRWA